MVVIRRPMVYSLLRKQHIQFYLMYSEKGFPTSLFRTVSYYEVSILLVCYQFQLQKRLNPAYIILPHSALSKVHYTLLTAHFTLYTVGCTPHSVHQTQYTHSPNLPYAKEIGQELGLPLPVSLFLRNRGGLVNEYTVSCISATEHCRLYGAFASTAWLTVSLVFYCTVR